MRRNYKGSYGLYEMNVFAIKIFLFTIELPLCIYPSLETYCTLLLVHLLITLLSYTNQQNIVPHYKVCIKFKIGQNYKG